ncbi:hypothetical protein [Streptomyces europaeiscabiei]|uniref:hypothetical protein n=1 Tax=Streptomyces europaeiscabiei TaxID=146819 RepID=UPI0029AE9DC7|nr:hypothetical protein [Streptomyces europaeiscabiei]MDX3587567.1 hypothetical protein [Streptomyces europaeiscabiei]WSG29178.1 hypothetical protein OHB30_50960 [Streptomyces europaeiscabiei]
MDRPLLPLLPLVVVDEAADVLARSPEARELMTKLLLTGRRNGIRVSFEGRRPLPHWQYPTPGALEDAADQ